MAPSDSLETLGPPMDNKNLKLDSVPTCSDQSFPHIQVGEEPFSPSLNPSILHTQRRERETMDFLMILFLILIVWTCIHFLLQTRNRKLPPGPFPLPIVGSLFKLGSKPNESLAQLAQLYGPLMTLQVGSLTTLVVSTATMANQLLLKHDLIFSGRTVADSTRVLNYHESSVVWTPPNPRWRTLRALLNTQIMTVKRLDANIGLRRAKVQELVSHVRDCTVTKRAVDVGRVAFATTLNLMSNTLFSVDLVDLGSEEVREFKDVVWGILEEAGRPNVSDYLPFLRWMDLQRVRRRSKGYIEKLYHLFDEMIDRRLRERSLGDYSRREDFLDVLLDHKEEEKGFQLKRHEIKALLVDIFVAGSDTSASTIEWAMAELLHNPDTMSMARSELKETVPKGKQLEESDIARLPYLQAVVKETLRLHPPAPLLIPHRAESTVEICGYIIPKDAQVIVNAWAIGRDPNAWTNPASFLPKRFLHSKLDFKGQDCQFIPFGAGRRICPGLPLALRMVHLMLASLLHSFAWELPNEMSPDEMNMYGKLGITLQLEDPLRAVPVQE